MSEDNGITFKKDTVGSGLSKEQLIELRDKIAMAYRAVAHTALYLEENDVGVLLAVISVGTAHPGQQKVLLVGNPSMPDDALKQLLALIGSDPDMGVEQAAVVRDIGLDAINREMKDRCDECPEAETCEERKQKVTIH